MRCNAKETITLQWNYLTFTTNRLYRKKRAYFPPGSTSDTSVEWLRKKISSWMTSRCTYRCQMDVVTDVTTTGRPHLMGRIFTTSTVAGVKTTRVGLSRRHWTWPWSDYKLNNFTNILELIESDRSNKCTRSGDNIEVATFGSGAQVILDDMYLSSRSGSKVGVCFSGSAAGDGFNDRPARGGRTWVPPYLDGCERIMRYSSFRGECWFDGGVIDDDREDCCKYKSYHSVNIFCVYLHCAASTTNCP